VPNLLSPALSLSAAISWGAADFSGGIATKTTNVFGVIVLAHATGLGFMLSLALVVGEPIPGWNSIRWGAVAGIVGGIGLAAFYKSLAVGTMGVNAPLSSVITAVVPLLFSFSTEGLPHPIQMTGFAFAILSIWLIAAQRGTASRSKGLGLAIVAGVGFGGFLLFMKLAGTQSGVLAACVSPGLVVSSHAGHSPVYWCRMEGEPQVPLLYIGGRCPGLGCQCIVRRGCAAWAVRCSSCPVVSLPGQYGDPRSTGPEGTSLQRLPT